MAKLMDMTDGSPSRLLLRLAWPAVVGNLAEQLYLLADKAIVGRYVGAEAFSAVGAVSAPVFVFMSLCIGTQTGIGILTAQYYGAGDHRGVASVIRNGAYVILLESLVMTLLAMFFSEPLLRLLGTPESLMADAVTYMKIYLAGLTSISVCFSCFHVLRALGNSGVPMAVVVFSSLLNVGLDLYFVAVLKAGVAGAALATALSQTAAAAACVIYGFVSVPYFREAFRSLRPEKDMVRRTVLVSLPAGGQNAFTYISGSLLQSIVNGFGVTAIGAFTATSQMESLIRHIYLGLGAASAAFTGQNMGAGLERRAREGAGAAVRISAAVSFVLAVTFLAGAGPIMSVFVEDPAMVELAARGMRILSLFFVWMGTAQVFHHFLNGAGDTVYPLVNGAVEAAARILFAAALALWIPGGGVGGIWTATGLAWLVSAVSVYLRYRQGRWRGKSLVRKE